jgi:outer membrane protein insertion porin family
VPIFDRLYLGGANNLRGFRFRDVGRRMRTVSLLAAIPCSHHVEYTFPVIDKVRGAVFYDAGFVNRGAMSSGLVTLIATSVSVFASICQSGSAHRLRYSDHER